MIVMRAAFLIVKGSAADRDDVVSVEEPVHILKPVLFDFRVIEDDAVDSPIDEVRGRGQRQGVADAAGVLGAMTLQNDAGQRIIELAWRIEANGKLLGAAGKL